jgi:hypothetical protein
MSERQTVQRRTIVTSVAVLVGVLVIVAIGYPGWLWFPLTISFWLAAATLVVSVVLALRRRYAHP